MLPGPSSTQLISAIGFRVGGPRLAYLTLLVWILPATIAMILAAIIIHFLQENSPKALQFAKFIQPMAIGILIFAAQNHHQNDQNSRSHRPDAAFGICLLLLQFPLPFSSDAPPGRAQYVYQV